MLERKTLLQHSYSIFSIYSFPIKAESSSVLYDPLYINYDKYLIKDKTEANMAA